MRAFRGVRIQATLIILLLAGCTNSDAATETLLDAGYTEVLTGGYDFWACGDGDFSATKFTALNPAGTRNVHGTVCCGLLKSCTIRH